MYAVGEQFQQGLFNCERAAASKLMYNSDRIFCCDFFHWPYLQDCWEYDSMVFT